MTGVITYVINHQSEQVDMMPMTHQQTKFKFSFLLSNLSLSMLNNINATDID